MKRRMENGKKIAEQYKRNVNRKNHPTAIKNCFE